MRQRETRETKERKDREEEKSREEGRERQRGRGGEEKRRREEKRREEKRREREDLGGSSLMPGRGLHSLVRLPRENKHRYAETVADDGRKKQNLMNKCI